MGLDLCKGRDLPVCTLALAHSYIILCGTRHLHPGLGLGPGGWEPGGPGGSGVRCSSALGFQARCSYLSSVVWRQA